MDVTAAFAGIWVSYHGGGCLTDTGNSGLSLHSNPQVNIRILYLNDDVYKVMDCTCRISILSFHNKREFNAVQFIKSTLKKPQNNLKKYMQHFKKKLRIDKTQLFAHRNEL